jgi:hypothetical protein
LLGFRANLKCLAKGLALRHVVQHQKDGWPSRLNIWIVRIMQNDKFISIPSIIVMSMIPEKPSPPGWKLNRHTLQRNDPQRRGMVHSLEETSFIINVLHVKVE